MTTLLVSLGQSPAIVVEAFLLPGARFDAVHVLTTASIRDSDVDFAQSWFADRAPLVRLTITRVAEFTDFRSEAEHFQFEEVLYRWWLDCAGPPGREEENRRMPFVCLAGGFKTMSSAMQKAAAVMGAEEVYHVLCDLPVPQQPKTAAEIEAARMEGHLHWIKLGEESGWPQFRHLRPQDFPLVEEKAEGCVRWVRAPDAGFRMLLRNVVERSHNIAGAWEHMESLPFKVLATWPPAHRAWLEEPLDVTDQDDREWVAALPKVELHCHLGGFATHGDLLRQVRAAAAAPERLPPLTEPAFPGGWPLPAETIALQDYMKLGDSTGSKLLKDPGCLRHQCELLYDHLCRDQVLYAEIRCSPNNYTSPGRSAWEVLTDIRNTFQECMTDSPQGCHVNLLIIATRKDGGDRSDISRHLALAVTAADQWKDGCRVVGVDLAGFEKPETRAALFATDFEPVHRVGLAVTVHAGENDDAEGIWQAVFKLNARRLGHALRLIDAPDLLRAVADRGIGVEMCPYANLQIKGFKLNPSDTQPDYPLAKYLTEGVPVTVNTDNIGISQAMLADNMLLAARLCAELTRLDILRLISNAADTAFLTPDEKTKLRSRLEARLHC